MSEEEFKGKKDDALSTKLEQKKQDPDHAHKLAKEEKAATAVHSHSTAMSAESQGTTAGQVLGMDRDTSQGAVTITAASLNIRSGPDKSSAPLGVLRMNDHVRIYAKINGFWLIHVGSQIGYIDAQFADFCDVASGEKKHDTERARVKRAYTGTKTVCDNPVYAGFVACLEALGIENPSPAMAFDSFLEMLRKRQKLRGGGMRRFGALANALGVNYRALAYDGDECTNDKQFWLETVREALEDGDEVLVDIDGTAMRVVEVTEKGIIFEGGRQEQISLGFDKLSDIGWIIALGG